MSIEKGYILLPRIFYDSELGEKPPHFREIWFWLIKEANHSEIKFKGRNLQRGQLLTSYQDIINGLKWRVGNSPRSYKKYQIETALKYYLKTGAVTIAKTTRGVIITICNYDFYQSQLNYESHRESHIENDRKTTPKPQDKQTLNNEKNNIDIYEFSFFEILFKEVEDDLKIFSENGLCQKLYDYYANNEWQLNSGRYIKTEKHLKAIIKKAIKNENQKTEKSNRTKQNRKHIISDLNIRIDNKSLTNS